MPRRTKSFLIGALTIAAAAVAAAPFAFLATSFYPDARWGVAAVFVAFGLGAWLVWRSERDNGPQDRGQGGDATAVIPRVEPIRPAAARGPRSVGRWLRHRRQSAKEAAR